MEVRLISPSKLIMSLVIAVLMSLIGGGASSCIYASRDGKMDFFGVVQPHTDIYSCLKQCTADQRCTAASISESSQECRFSFSYDYKIVSSDSWKLYVADNCERDIYAGPPRPTTTTTTTPSPIYKPDGECLVIKTIHKSVHGGHLQAYVVEEECINACKEDRNCYCASFNDFVFPHQCKFSYEKEFTLKAEVGARIFRIENCQRGIFVDPRVTASSTQSTTTVATSAQGAASSSKSPACSHLLSWMLPLSLYIIKGS